jgi:hypothetical protein
LLLRKKTDTDGTGKNKKCQGFLSQDISDRKEKKFDLSILRFDLRADVKARR